MQKLRLTLFLFGLLVLIPTALANHLFGLGGGCLLCGPYTDYYDALEATTLNVAAPGVLETDTSTDFEPVPGLILDADDVIDVIVLNAPVVIAEAQGTITIQQDGSFEFVPAAGYCRNTFVSPFDAFQGFYDTQITYESGGVQYINTLIETPVVIFVECQVGALPDVYFLISGENTVTDSAPGILDNDVVRSYNAAGDVVNTDIDAGITAALFNTPILVDIGLGNVVTVGELPQYGTVTVNSDGSFEYVADTVAVDNLCATFSPDPGDANGFAHDDFWYEATVGGFSDVGVVVIYLCEENVFLVDDINFTIPENTVLEFNVFDYVTFIPNDPALFNMTLNSIFQPDDGHDHTHGETEFFDDGTVIFTPETDFFGTVTLLYSVNDSISGISSSATIIINVTEVNGNANGNGNGTGNPGNGNNGLGNSGDNGNAQGDPQRPDNTSGNANGTGNANGNGNGNGGGNGRGRP